MRRGVLAVGREHQLAAGRRHLRDQALDGRHPARVPVDRADVDDADALREAPHDVRVDLGIVLAAVSNKNEWQPRVRPQQGRDRRALVVARHAQPQVAQEERSLRQSLHL